MEVRFILSISQMKDTVTAAFDSGLALQTHDLTPPHVPLYYKFQKAS